MCSSAKNNGLFEKMSIKFKCQSCLNKENLKTKTNTWIVKCLNNELGNKEIIFDYNEAVVYMLTAYGTEIE